MRPGSRIDVVIPVYNAPDLVRRCIESLYRHASAWLGSVHVHDNASDAETRAMLDALDHPGLTVHHAGRNFGFGEGVNQGVRATTSELVLVLNSDVVAEHDFIAPLHQALSESAALCVVTPGGNTFDGYDLSRYALHAGCVPTYNLHGYAFLIRRGAFEAVGGFDPSFGLGFFEDRDLSRKLVAKGHRLGVHPRARLQHRIHGSFEKIPAFRELIEQNRRLYLKRYPGAERHLLIVSGARHVADLAPRESAELETLLSEGGSAHWLTRAGRDRVPALEVRVERWGVRGLRRVLRRHRHKPHQRFSEVWMASDAPWLARAWLRRWTEAERLRLRVLG